MRPISNVVDVTNYVMLALGSPLHAFDLSLLAEGRIVVRRAHPGEKIRTLDGHERELAPTDLVIADAKRPVAIAGIMGGEDSEVRPETTDLLLEAANFDAARRCCARRGGCGSARDASTRWEKGVDPYAAEQAAVYATRAPRRARRRALDRPRRRARRAARAAGRRARPELADRLSGMTFPVDEQRERLRGSASTSRTTEVTVPTWRARDVTRTVDLVEEVVRFRIEEVPATLPARATRRRCR